MAIETGVGALAFLLGRLLFGGLLAFAGLNHFMNADEMTEYAEAKGVPAPAFSVITSGSMLVFGGLGIAFGVYPILAAGAIATFFTVVTPLMHDFWAVSEEQREAEFTNFIKNAELLGASLIVLAVADRAWRYALNISI